MARVELRDVSKVWDRATAVRSLDLTIEDGEFVAVLGPSGCGKSTTLFMLAGIYLPTTGDILFDGARVNDVEARDRNVGVVFQSYALYPHMTAMQNIAFPLRFQNLAPKVAEARAREAATLTQIEGLLDRRPSELSGGQQQRVALARALVKRPNLLLLDEPLSNLDATLRLTMRAELKRLTRRLGVTTILVTHDQIEATTMADRVVCMNAGRIEQVGTAEDLYARPDTLFVAGFIGAPPMNRMPARAEARRLTVGQARLAVDGAEGAVTVGLRPEALHAAEAGLPGRVVSVEPMGREALYAADTPAGVLHFLEAGAQPRLREGDVVALRFAPGDTILFDAEGRRIPGATAALEPAHA